MIESVYSINYINYVVVVVTGQHTPHSTLQSPGSRGWPGLARAGRAPRQENYFTRNYWTCPGLALAAF